MIDPNLARARAVIRLDHEIQIPVLEKALGHVVGIMDFEINHVNGTIRVEYDPQKITFEDIRNIVKK